jgi:hypothetical protein
MKEGKGGKMAIAGNPNGHTISITVDNDGHFSYENPLIWVYPGDTIVWECTNNYPFAIHIGWNSPAKGRYRSVDGKPIEAQIRGNAQFGYYHYIVAVYDKNTGKIWIDDPPFIVKPPGS